MSSTPLVRRVFINQERPLGRNDYGAEFRMWWVKDAGRLVPVRRASGARILDREGFDRLPAGVMSRIAVEVHLPIGTEVTLMIRRPKAARLPRTERHTYILTRHGELSRQGRQPKKASPKVARPRLPVHEQAELARRLVGELSS